MLPLMIAGLCAITWTGRLVLEASPRTAPRSEPGTAPQDPSRLESDRPRRGVESVRVTPVVHAVRKAGPSVVNIQVGDLVESLGGETIFRKLGEGSGVIVSEQGLVLTNWHVVRFQNRVRHFHCQVSLRDGSRYRANVLNISRENDLALLAIRPEAGDSPRFPPIAMGDSDTLMVGETVIAIGNPRGQENTVTTGVLSAVNRKMSVTPRGESRPIVFKELLQTDAAINPGNSGGALLDITGKLIGINTLMQIESQNIGYAIPVNHVRKVFEDRLLNVDHLGVWTGLELREEGGNLIVGRVARGGPADRARIQVGDRVLRVGGMDVRSEKEFAEALVRYSAGQRVPVQVRGGSGEKVRRIVGWSRSNAMIYKLIGIYTVPLNERGDRRLYWTVHDEIYGRSRGPLDPVRVTAVQPGSPAADLGLKPGDVIVGFYDRYRELSPLVGGNPALANQLQQARGDKVWLSVFREGEGLLHGRVAVRDG